MKKTSIVPCCHPKIHLLLGRSPNPAGGAYDTLPDPLVDWGGRPSPNPSHSMPGADPEGGAKGPWPPQTVGLLYYIMCLK